MSQRPAPRLDLMPSAADRWTTCAASPRFILENAHLIPEDLSSKFSLEGNTAHEVAAAFLQDREPDPKNCPTPIDADMRMHGFDYADYVQSLRKPGSKLLVEQKQPLWYYEGRNAIVDAAVINPDSLHIVDFKYGAGVAVSPVENLQTTIYAYQVGHKLTLPLDFPVFSHIYQPRNRESDSPEKVWQTTIGDIAERAGRISAQATIIQINNETKGNPLPFAPSEKACRWCPAKAFCPAREHEMLSDFEPLVVKEPETLPMPAALSIEQLAAVLRHGKKIQKWVDDAFEYATERLKEGHEIPGFKLVLSKGGHRFWKDEKRAAELLVLSTILSRKEVVEEKVKSVAAIEKLIGKKKFSAELTALIGKPEGSPQLAPADDPRESCAITAATEFVALTDEALDRLDDY